MYSFGDKMYNHLICWNLYTNPVYVIIMNTSSFYNICQEIVLNYRKVYFVYIDSNQWILPRTLYFLLSVCESKVSLTDMPCHHDLRLSPLGGYITLRINSMKHTTHKHISALLCVLGSQTQLSVNINLPLHTPVQVFKSYFALFSFSE